jgi:multimeric flavodoxin WrbA
MRELHGISSVRSGKAEHCRGAGFMKILVIMGSPRNGNTVRILNEIEKEMRKLGDVEFEAIALRDVQLGLCRGCHLCLFKGEGSCPQKDDRQQLEEKMLNADGVIFASPNYASGVTALFKNFVDRFAYAGHRPRFFRTRAMAVVTSAGPGGLSETVAYMSASLAAYGFRFVHTAGFFQPPFPLPEAWRKDNEEKVRTAACIFFTECGSSGLPVPKLKEVMGFRIMQLLLLKVKGTPLEKVYPADCKYWEENGWLDAGRWYFTDERVGIFHKLIVRLLELVISRQMDKMFSDSASPPGNR